MAVSFKDGSTVRSEFAYYVPRSLNPTVPEYRTSVQLLKRSVRTYRIRTITKKAYRVPFLLKIQHNIKTLQHDWIYNDFPLDQPILVHQLNTKAVTR